MNRRAIARRSAFIDLNDGLDMYFPGAFDSWFCECGDDKTKDYPININILLLCGAPDWSGRRGGPVKTARPLYSGKRSGLVTV